ncbi:MAG TPA: HAD-IA family hydrolase [Solimonas sp.]|nr:HAD-IA family hydrolase [Solimonas sp.]
MTPSLRCMLFDLDGTLVDTAPDLGHAANLVRESLGMAPLPLVDYRPVASAGARGLLKTALGITPEHADFPKHRDAFLDLYRRNLSRHSCLFEGMDEVLRAMEARGIRWGVMTNKPAWLTRPLMEELQLAQRSAVTLSADEVAQPKPAPDGLYKACELLGLAPADCIYVGDDHRDIVAGRAAGMRTIAADWGYLGEGGPIEGWAADAIARQPQDLHRWLA